MSETDLPRCLGWELYNLTEGIKHDPRSEGTVSAHGLAIARSRLQHALEEAVFPPKTDPTNERLAQHL
jgi:hypothetical protein